MVEGLTLLKEMSTLGMVQGNECSLGGGGEEVSEALLEENRITLWPGGSQRYLREVTENKNHKQNI